jgi:hypothetical protein
MHSFVDSSISARRAKSIASEQAVTLLQYSLSTDAGWYFVSLRHSPMFGCALKKINSADHEAIFGMRRASTLRKVPSLLHLNRL